MRGIGNLSVTFQLTVLTINDLMTLCVETMTTEDHSANGLQPLGTELIRWIDLSRQGEESFPRTRGGCTHRQTEGHMCRQKESSAC